MLTFASWFQTEKIQRVIPENPEDPENPEKPPFDEKPARDRLTRTRPGPIPCVQGPDFNASVQWSNLATLRSAQPSDS